MWKLESRAGCPWRFLSCHGHLGHAGDGAGTPQALRAGRPSSTGRQIIPLHFDKALKVVAKFIADASKSRQPFFFGALHSGGVVEAPMDAQGVGWKHGPAPPGGIATG